MTQSTDAADVAPEANRLGRKRDHTRDPEILRAAVDILIETGYEGMTIDMVAARVKAGKATLYRRWASKEELVIDAVAFFKGSTAGTATLPDTGTLRGDLVAMIKPNAIEDGERKVQLYAGLMSMLAKRPDLAEAAQLAILEPRIAVNRQLLARAIERGEVASTVNVELLATVSTAVVSYRVLLERAPVTPEFLISIVDDIIMPAVGLSAEANAS